MYVFDVAIETVATGVNTSAASTARDPATAADSTTSAAVPRINLDNVTAVGTMHNSNSTKRIDRPVDSEWLVQAFNKQSTARLVPSSTLGTFKVEVSPPPPVA